MSGSLFVNISLDIDRICGNYLVAMLAFTNVQGVLKRFRYQTKYGPIPIPWDHGLCLYTCRNYCHNIILYCF